MAGIDLTTAETTLSELLAAQSKILAGQRVEMEGRSLTRANLADVQAGIDYWDRQCQRLSLRARGRGRISRVVGARG